MNSQSSRPFQVFLALVSAGSLLCATVAQDESPDGGDAGPKRDPAFRITKIETPKFVSSPDFSSALKGKTTRRKVGWLELETEFAWQPKDRQNQFLDEVTVRFYVLLAAPGKDHSLALLQGETVYQHVAASNSIRSAMFVSPRSLEMLFNEKVPSTANSAVVNIGVVILRNGGIVEMTSWKEPREFWQNQKILEASKEFPGLLLRKSQTPFAHAAWDYYEEEKVEAR